MTLDTIIAAFGLDQIIILCTGVPAVFLSQGLSAARRRWAPIFGLLGQPAWIYMAIEANKAGVFLVTLLYTYSWLRGFNNQWIRPWLRLRREARQPPVEPYRYSVSYIDKDGNEIHNQNLPY